MPITTPIRFSEQGRSGTRMLIGMPVTLTGKNELGRDFEEKTRTVVINQTGCKLMSEQPFVTGSKMTLSTANSKRTVAMTVAWTGEKKGKQTEIGADFDKPDATFWGVNFPEDPKDATSPNLKVTPVAPAPAPEPAKASAPPALKAAAPAPEPAPAEASAPPSPVPASAPRKDPSPAIIPDVSAPTPARIPPPQSPVSVVTAPASAGPAPAATGDLASSTQRLHYETLLRKIQMRHAPRQSMAECESVAASN